MRNIFVYILLLIVGGSISWIYFKLISLFVNSLYLSMNNANLIGISLIFVYLVLVVPIILVILKKLKNALI